MKNTKYIFCFALSFAFGISYAQPSLSNNYFSNDQKITMNTALIDEPEDPTIQNDGKLNYHGSYRRNSEETSILLHPKLKIYPEPFKGFVSVDLSTCPDAKICLYYESGKCLMYRDCLNETSAIFNLKNEPKGFYFMEIVSGGKKIVKKIDLE